MSNEDLDEEDLLSIVEQAVPSLPWLSYSRSDEAHTRVQGAWIDISKEEETLTLSVTNKLDEHASWQREYTDLQVRRKTLSELVEILKIVIPLEEQEEEAVSAARFRCNTAEKRLEQSNRDLEEAQEEFRVSAILLRRLEARREP